MSVLAPTPELDRQHDLFTPRPVNHVLSEFYDWLEADGIVLARWGEPYEVAVECPDCNLIRGVQSRRIRQRNLDVLGIKVRRVRGRRVRSGTHYSGVTMNEASDYEAKLRARYPCPTCADAQGKYTGGSSYGFVYERRVREDRLTPAHEPPYALFARFLALDPDKLEAERRAILDELGRREHDRPVGARHAD